jgi:Ca-activated chloride channel homolog
MNIKHPELLVLILVFVAVLFLLNYAWKRRKHILTAFCDSKQLSNIFPNVSPLKNSMRFILLSLATLMFITALISPRWGYDWQEVESKGVNIMIALDLSKSMLAEDISPNRISRAKLEIIKLLDKLNGDKVGLIIFAGESFLQSPLTHDYLMVKDWILQISPDSIAVEGTSIKSAIELGRKSFKHLTANDPKAMIIISDGEEQDQATLDEAKRAKSEGIKIYTIGIGTNEGGPIKINDSLLRDANDNVVISRLDDALLKQIAELSSAFYVRSSTGDFHLDTLYYDHIKGEVQAKVLKSGKSKLWNESYQIFMAIGFVALLLELFISFNMFSWFNIVLSWMNKNNNNIFRLKAKHKVLILFLLLNHPVKANVFDASLWSADSKLQTQQYSLAKEEYLKLQVKEPHNSRLNYNLGVSLYRTDTFTDAVSSFLRSSTESKIPELQERALYNLGNSYFKMENYKDAISAYEKALAINAKDEDAKFNLELAKKLLDDQKQDGDKNGDNKNDQKKNNKEQEKDKKQNQENKDNQDKNKDKNNQPQNQPKLSNQDIDNILRNANEAGPPQQRKTGAPPKNNLKPW